jgi:MerR family redox-sensitive transcriptional activator SoxR
VVQKSIGVVAKEAGVAASTIRYYERIGLLPELGRSGGKRRYDDSVSAQLRVIRLAQQGGFSIREIKTLLHGFPSETSPAERWRALSIGKIKSLETKITHLREMKSMLMNTLRCHCATLADCASEQCHDDGRTSLSLCVPCSPAAKPAASGSSAKGANRAALPRGSAVGTLTA